MLERGSDKSSDQYDFYSYSKDGNYKILLFCNVSDKNYLLGNSISIEAKSPDAFGSEERTDHATIYGSNSPLLNYAGILHASGGGSAASPPTNFSSSSMAERILHPEQAEALENSDKSLFKSFVYTLVNSIESGRILRSHGLEGSKIQVKITRTDGSPLYMEWDTSDLQSHLDEIKQACGYEPSYKPE